MSCAAHSPFLPCLASSMTRETPQQVMRTQNLTRRDPDVRDVRINVKFDQYGYLDIEEARQGRNGECCIKYVLSY